MQKDRWKDHYFHKAKREGFFARSIYKLEEADKKFNLVNSGANVLDLGCAPGSWLQYLSKKVGKEGKVVGVDLVPSKFSANNTKTIVADVLSIEIEELRKLGSFDLVTSDLAPSTRGIPEADAAKSLELAKRAFEIARLVLKSGGKFFVKIFEGPDTKKLRDEMKNYFEQVKAFKPKASRAESREYYIVGLGFKPK